MALQTYKSFELATSNIKRAKRAKNEEGPGTMTWFANGKEWSSSSNNNIDSHDTHKLIHSKQSGRAKAMNYYIQSASDSKIQEQADTIEIPQQIRRFSTQRTLHFQTKD